MKFAFLTFVALCMIYTAIRLIQCAAQGIFPL